MRPEVAVEVREWLERAADDLREAEHDLTAAPPLLRGAVFHSQQAAEKALKAFLAWRNQPLPRTHDLPALLVRCQALEPAFAALPHAARTLDVYLTAGRYPDTGPEPSAAKAAQALQLAEQVVTFVAARLPQGGQP